MGLIKKLIGGIFAFLGGLFSIFKKSEYFLEMDDDQPPSAPKPAPQPKPMAEPVKAPSSNNKASEVKPAPLAPVPVAAAVATAPAPQPVVVPKPEPKSEPVPTTFAPDNLLTITNGRRRPGPSLNRFVDMAKQVKTP